MAVKRGGDVGDCVAITTAEAWTARRTLDEIGRILRKSTSAFADGSRVLFDCPEGFEATIDVESTGRIVIGAGRRTQSTRTMSWLVLESIPDGMPEPLGDPTGFVSACIGIARDCLSVALSRGSPSDPESEASCLRHARALIAESLCAAQPSSQILSACVMGPWAKAPGVTTVFGQGDPRATETEIELARLTKIRVLPRPSAHVILGGTMATAVADPAEDPAEILRLIAQLEKTRRSRRSVEPMQDDPSA